MGQEISPRKQAGEHISPSYIYMAIGRMVKNYNSGQGHSRHAIVNIIVISLLAQDQKYEHAQVICLHVPQLFQRTWAPLRRWRPAGLW